MNVETTLRLTPPRLPRFMPWLAGLALLVISCAAASAQTTGFNQTSGAKDYNDTANWVGGDINGIFDVTLTLTGALAPTFGHDTTLLTGLTMAYTGGQNVVFRADGTGPYTLTLGGDIIVDTASGNRLVTFGSSVANQGLRVDLGGATRTFTVSGSSNAPRRLIFANEVLNGGFVATGGGLVFLNNASNTLTEVTVGGNEVDFDGSANAGVDTTNTVTGALSIGTGGVSSQNLGSSVITLETASGQNTTLQANSLSRAAGGAVLFRGTNLGGAAFGAANTANVRFTVAPTLSGTGSSGSTIGIIAGAFGDSSANGTGFGSTGGLVTYDAATGVRLLTASEYATSITDGQTDLTNVRLENTSGVASTVTLNDNTAINSLSLVVSTADGSGITLNGTGTLTVNSGVIYATSSGTAKTSASAMVVNNDIDLNGQEGVVLFSTAGISNGNGGANLELGGAITHDGGNGVTFSGPGAVEISGATANTYTGITTVNGGYVSLHKTNGVNAIGGDLVVDGGTVLWGASNQIADSANITLNRGSVQLRPATSTGSSSSETFNNLTMHGGSFLAGTASNSSSSVNLHDANLAGGQFTLHRNNKVNLSGSMSISNGGNVIINRSNSAAGNFDTVLTLNGGLSITNTANGSYTAISFAAGTSATNMGGRLVLAGDVTFTGNGTNTNTVLIDGPTGDFGNAGVIALDGDRTFDIGNGAAASDLTISAPLVDVGTGTAGGVVKTGLGTLEFQGANTYTGPTSVNAGTLLINGSGASAVTVNSGGTLGGTGTVGNAVTINDGGVLAPGNSPGTLSTGDLAFTGEGSVLALEFSGAGVGAYDQVSVTGAVNLDGNGQIELTLDGFTPGTGDLFFVILNDGADAINGTFFGLAQGAVFNAGGQAWQISYTADFDGGVFTGGNDLAVMVVPEPQAWMLLGAGLMVLLGIRRRPARA